MPTHALREQADHWLKTAIGDHAEFRQGQWEAIEALVVNRQRRVAILSNVPLAGTARIVVKTCIWILSPGSSQGILKLTV